MRPARTALLLSGLALSASLTAQASDPQTAATTNNDVSMSAEAGADNAVMAAIDPKTGKLRPVTAAEAQALQTKAAAMRPLDGTRAAGIRSRAPATAADAARTKRRQATGGIALRAPMSSMSSLTATRAADGSLQFDETDHPQLAPQRTQQEVSE